MRLWTRLYVMVIWGTLFLHLHVHVGALEMSNCIELNIILELKISLESLKSMDFSTTSLFVVCFLEIHVHV